MGVAQSQRGIHIFKIRQIDIHQPLHFPERIPVFITPRIVNYRQIKPLPFCCCKRFRDLRHKVPGRHKIDIVRPLRLQLQKYLSQPFHRDIFSCRPVGYLFILTEHAVQGAAREKYRP